MSSDSELDEDTPRPVFPLPPAREPPLNRPPQTAEEYLQQVRHESAQLPSVFVAERRTSLTPSVSKIRARLRLPLTPDHLLPHKDWEQQTLIDFAAVQQQLQQVNPIAIDIPKRGNSTYWRQLLFENDVKPTCTFVAALGHVRVMDALKIVDEELDVSEFDEKADETSASAANKMQACAQWVYALLVAVEKPLCAESAGVIRSLLRKMVIARLALSDDEKGLASVNVLISILDKHFGQGDIS